MIIISRLVLDCWFLGIDLSHGGCFTGHLNDILIFGSVPLIAHNIGFLVMRHARSHTLSCRNVLGRRHSVVGIGAFSLKKVSSVSVIENAAGLLRDIGIVVSILFTSFN